MVKELIIPQKIENLMKSISYKTGIKEFILFGGNVIDYFLSKKLNTLDIDIIIEGTNTKKINKIIQDLKNRGFHVSKKRRYYILMDKKIYLLQATKDKFNLDIAFTNEPKILPGPFNALSMYCEFPGKICYDPYGCIDSIKNKSFSCIPSKNFKNENPYILISRFILLCSKYNASISQSKEHKKIIEEFNKKKKTFKIDTTFKKEVFLSFISKIFKSILLSKNKKRFIKELKDSDILIDTFDELNEALKIAGSKKYGKNIHKIKDKLNLINYFGQILQSKKKKKYFSIIGKLSSREWDEGDKSLKVNKK